MFTPINLFEATELSGSATTVYTSPTAASNSAAANTQMPTRTLIKKVTVTNITGSEATLTVSLVAKGGTAGSANTVIYQKSIPAGVDMDLYSLQGHVLETGDFIVMTAGTASALVVRGSGVQIQ